MRFLSERGQVVAGDILNGEGEASKRMVPDAISHLGPTS